MPISAQALTRSKERAHCSDCGERRDQVDERDLCGRRVVCHRVAPDLAHIFRHSLCRHILAVLELVLQPPTLTAVQANTRCEQTKRPKEATAVLRCAVCCDALRRAAPDPNRAEIHRSFDDRQVVGAVEEHGVHRHRKRHRKLVVEQVLDHGLRRPALGSASHTTNAVDRGRPATEAQAQAQARGSGQAAYLAVLEGVFQATLPPARGGHLCVRRTGVWTPTVGFGNGGGRGTHGCEVRTVHALGPRRASSALAQDSRR